jgi:hypothetical protein
VRSLKGTGRDHVGRARNGGCSNWEPEHLPNKPFHSSIQVCARQWLAIEHAVTADMADGQPMPPLIEDGLVWHMVRRADEHTFWRRIILQATKQPDPATRRRIIKQAASPSKNQTRKV